MIFTAKCVPIINLSYAPDRQLMVIPPEAFITIPSKIKVTYGIGDEIVGTATLRRVGNQVLANMTLRVTDVKLDSAEKAIRKLYPGVTLEIQDWVGQTVFKLKIKALTLTPYQAADTTIETIDKYLMRGQALEN